MNRIKNPKSLILVLKSSCYPCAGHPEESVFQDVSKDRPDVNAYRTLRKVEYDLYFENPKSLIYVLKSYLLINLSVPATFPLLFTTAKYNPLLQSLTFSLVCC